MGAILTDEKKTYQEVYDLLSPTYGSEEDDSPGHLFCQQFLDLAGPERGTVFDAGCGGGRGALALKEAGFEVVLGDLLDVRIDEARSLPFYEVCLWRSLRPQIKRGQVDWVYCSDVLEHLPTQFVGLAVEQMLRIANRGVFLSVMMKEDRLGILVGKPLHQTVRPYRWWRETCAELGRVTDARDLGVWATFVVEPTR